MVTTQKARETRRQRNRELALADAHARCAHCRIALGKGRWQDATDARVFCSQECLDAAFEVDQLRGQPMTREAR